MGSSQSRLLRRRAFVVQVREGARLGSGEILGRVERVDSGRRARFWSRQELNACVVEIPSESATGHDEEPE